MDNPYWMVPAAIGVIIATSFIALIGQLIAERLKAKRNRIYKTTEDHIILNSSSRDEWMSGQLAGQDREKVDRLSSLLAPIAQIVTVAALAAVVIVWNGTLIKANARMDERLSQLELQIHALAISPPASNAPASAETDFPGGAAEMNGPASKGTPMQQACANLIGRVADAYEKAESSKIGQSLEQLVQKLGCINSSPQ
jgi:hypothetical protein